MARKLGPIKDRFAGKYSISNNGCWLWHGTKSGDGYGRILNEKRTRVMAHRASYEIHVGPIPNGMLVLHKCDTPACINPSHLFLGTDADNMKDKMAKNRGGHLSGQDAGMAKLTNDQVIAIRSSVGITITALAHSFGISRRAIRFILDRATYKNVG